MAKAAVSTKAAPAAAKPTALEALQSKYSGEVRQDASLTAMKRNEGNDFFNQGLQQQTKGYEQGLKTATDPDNRYRASKVAQDTLAIENAKANIAANAKFKADTGMDSHQAEMWRGREFNKKVNESNNERAASNAVLEEQLATSRAARSGTLSPSTSSNSSARSSSPGPSQGHGQNTAGRSYASMYNEMEEVQKELMRSSALTQSVQAAKTLYR